MIRAILLDVYGTVIATPVYLSPYAHIVGPLRSRGEEAVRRAVRGISTRRLDTVEDAARYLEQEFPGYAVQPDAIRRGQEELERHLQSFVPMDGVEEVAAALKAGGCRLALVSNTATPYTEPMRRLGIEALVEHCIYSCDVGFAKPDREIFAIALARAGVPREEAVMVGDDEEADIEGARGAGLRAIQIGDAGEGAISLCELPAALARLEQQR